MPVKLKHIFEREYGKQKGDRIFYAYEAKHGHHYSRKKLNKIKRLKGGKK